MIHSIYMTALRCSWLVTAPLRNEADFAMWQSIKEASRGH